MSTTSVAHTLFRVKGFLSYWLQAVDEHSLHSPFLYDFYTTVLKPPAAGGKFDHIEKLRRKLLRDNRVLRVSDLGANQGQQARRRISFIARTSLSTPRFSWFYWRLANYYSARTIVELGTSLGINTLYLAERKDAAITTFEGSLAVAEVASSTFESGGGGKNIEMITGNIDATLPLFLEKVRKVDLVFMDANHRYEPTVKYFEWFSGKVHERSVIVVDDIHHSPEMERAWKSIQRHHLVYATVDLFRSGIVFFDPSLNKQHVILQV